MVARTSVQVSAVISLQVKDGNNISGRGRKSTPFYEEIDAILGHRAASQPMVLIGSGNTETGAAGAIEVQQGVVIDELEEVSELGKWLHVG